MAPVALRVESGDELSVLAGHRVKFKHVDLPVIGCAYKLGPVTLGHGAIGRIRGNVAQVCAPIFISKRSDVRLVGEGRDFLNMIDRIQVRQQRNGQPVASRYPLIND